MSTPALRIQAGEIEIGVELDATPTAKAVLEALPFESRAQTWGDEVYFEVPVSVELEPGARMVVEPGTVCFWIEGQSIALPFGPTPISKAGEPRLVARCNVFGRVLGDPRVLAKVKAGDRVIVARA